MWKSDIITDNVEQLHLGEYFQDILQCELLAVTLAQFFILQVIVGLFIDKLPNVTMWLTDVFFTAQTNKLKA